MTLNKLIERLTTLRAEMGGEVKVVFEGDDEDDYLICLATKGKTLARVAGGVIEVPVVMLETD